MIKYIVVFIDICYGLSTLLTNLSHPRDRFVNKFEMIDYSTVTSILFSCTASCEDPGVSAVTH